MTVKKSKRLRETFLSPRFLISVVTAAVLVLIIYLSRHELLKAWGLLGRADMWLLLLLLPIQIAVYYVGGEMIFCYLRDKKLIQHVSHFEQARIALELNLVNHLFPSGGVSGISYTSWRMHKLGVSTSRSTFAQLIRYITGFMATVVLLIISVCVLALDGKVNRFIVVASFLLVLLVVVMSGLAVFVFSSQRRMHKVARRLTRGLNRLMCWLTLGRRRHWLNIKNVERFFADMHTDFQQLSKDRRLIVKPFLWGLVYTTLDVLMFVVAFWALGVSVNPAALVVGYGIATFAGVVAVTPGGAGFYETIMIAFLGVSGMPGDVAIAGVVLTRAILLTGTILCGYLFYQHALIKYGKPHEPKIQR